MCAFNKFPHALSSSSCIVCIYKGLPRFIQSEWIQIVYRYCWYFVGDFPSAASIYQNRESVQWGSPGPSEADQPEGQLHGTPRAR